MIETTSAAFPGLLSRNAAARFLAISVRKLDQLAASGELRRVKIDSCVRFERSDLDAFVSARKTT